MCADEGGKRMSLADFTPTRFDALRFEGASEREVYGGIQRILRPLEFAQRQVERHRAEGVEEVNFVAVRIGGEPEKKMNIAEFNDYLVHLHRKASEKRWLP